MENLLEKAQTLWNEYQRDAQWDPYDRVDSYSTECNISLEVDGFVFEGRGVVCCGENIPMELICASPDGTKLRIY